MADRGSEKLNVEGPPDGDTVALVVMPVACEFTAGAVAAAISVGVTSIDESLVRGGTMAATAASALEPKAPCVGTGAPVEPFEIASATSADAGRAGPVFTGCVFELLRSASPPPHPPASAAINMTMQLLIGWR